MHLFLKLILTSITVLLLFSSCGKGYEVRVTNRYIEDMDSVLVGDDLIYLNVVRQQTTDYSKIKKGTYTVTLISKTKKRIFTSIQIPQRKSGKRTIQIDGSGAVQLLED